MTSKERDRWVPSEPPNSTAHLDLSKAIQAPEMPKLKPSTETISLRLPKYLLDSIRLAANSRDVPYQSLIKLWLQEKLQDRSR